MQCNKQKLVMPVMRTILIDFKGLVVALGWYRPVEVAHEWDLFANESSLTVDTSNFTSGVKLVGTGVTLRHCDMNSVLTKP